jgi:hypothetical protein
MAQGGVPRDSQSGEGGSSPECDYLWRRASLGLVHLMPDGDAKEQTLDETMGEGKFVLGEGNAKSSKVSHTKSR